MYITILITRNVILPGDQRELTLVSPDLISIAQSCKFHAKQTYAILISEIFLEGKV